MTLGLAQGSLLNNENTSNNTHLRVFWLILQNITNEPTVRLIPMSFLNDSVHIYLRVLFI